MSVGVIVRSGRTFVALRKAGRRRRTANPVYRAVTPHRRVALCADEPGAGSGWAEPPAERVTRPACLHRPARLGGPDRADGAPDRS